MKKISLLITIVGFVCSFCLVNNVWAKKITLNSENPDDQIVFDQVYLQNEYVLDHLQTLVRTVNKKPQRIGSRFEKANDSLLVFKLNSLNYMIRKIFQPDVVNVYHPLEQHSTLDSHGLLVQSRQMLQIFPELFSKYQQQPPVGFEREVATGWYVGVVTREKLYQQLLQIESFLNGLSNVIKPNSVYEVMFSTQSLLIEHCKSQKEIIVSPAIMGKRPKDVYLHLFDYMTLLTHHTSINKYPKGPVHIFPSDVFDLAIVALAYSFELISEEQYILISNREKVEMSPPLPNDASIITPSHVFQLVDENITLLECEKHASR